MHWSLDSAIEAANVATIRKIKGFLKSFQIRGVMAILILISLIFVAVQSAFLLHRLDQLNERLGPLQEKRLDLHIEPDDFYAVPMFIYETEEEIAI
jgi:hypothetical protein